MISNKIVNTKNIKYLVIRVIRLMNLRRNRKRLQNNVLIYNMKLFFLLKLKINNYNSNLVTNQLSKNHRQKKNMNFLAKIEKMK